MSRLDEQGGAVDDDGTPELRPEWTGERMVPWTDDFQVVYEHLHRYSFASLLVDGQRVLDLASGEGYGTSLVGRRAKEAVGVEIDRDVVKHAQATYGGANVRFEAGSITDRSVLAGDDGTFDVVTCFEAIEHVDDHEAVLDNVQRLLRPGGLFIVSTPDEAVYNAHLDSPNEFHVHELTRAEFERLLRERFANVTFLGQEVVTGSMISRVDGEGGTPHVVTVHADPDERTRWRVDDAFEPVYLIAIASDDPLPPLPSASVLHDEEMLAIRRPQGAFEDAHRRELALAAELDTTRHFEKKAFDLERANADLHERIVDLQARVAKLNELERALVYRFLQKYRSVLEEQLPQGTQRRRVYNKALREVRRLAGTRLGSSRPITLRSSDEPLVSILIPVHGGWSVTEGCLRALEEAHIGVPYEVIVVDDASPDDTRERLGRVAGLHVVPIDTNVGFLLACNAGVRTARGRYVLFLNNDAYVHPGAIDTLVRPAENDPLIGVVGAKLVYADGTLQEAGSIIWSDGMGWNYGRNDNPDSPAYDYPREVDYCSAAAALVRAELLDKTGGFDERFVPAYFEDTDLCFEARAHGYRVVYQPRARVLHLEGKSHGTDEATGIKRYQEINKRKFAEKWAGVLSTHYPNDPKNVPLAKERSAKGRVFVADHLVPTFDLDGGSLRMYRLLRLLRELGYAVTFLPADRYLRPRYTQALLDVGIEVIDSDRDVTQVLEELAPGLRAVVLSRRTVAWRLLEAVQDAAPNVPLVFDTVDLHFLREEYEAEVEDTDEARERARIGRERELSLVRMATSTWVVSYEELELLRSLVPGARVDVVPNIHDRQPTGAGFESRTGVLLVANWPHPPNKDGLVWFLDEILPLVRSELPDLELHLVGGGLPDEIVRRLDKNTVVHGWVPELEPVYDAVRLSIAPLRYGAGMKGKVAEALAHGVPIITTPVGTEGMAPDVVDAAIVATDAASFADAIVTTYRDADRWQAIHESGPDVIDAAYGAASVATTLETILDELAERRPTREPA